MNLIQENTKLEKFSSLGYEKLSNVDILKIYAHPNFPFVTNDIETKVENWFEREQKLFFIWAFRLKVCHAIARKATKKIKRVRERKKKKTL